MSPIGLASCIGAHLLNYCHLTITSLYRRSHRPLVDGTVEPNPTKDDIDNYCTRAFRDPISDRGNVIVFTVLYKYFKDCEDFSMLSCLSILR